MLQIHQSFLGSLQEVFKFCRCVGRKVKYAIIVVSVVLGKVRMLHQLFPWLSQNVICDIHASKIKIQMELAELRLYSLQCLNFTKLNIVTHL